MIKTIELCRENIARIKEKEPFYLPDTLVLDFESTRYDLSNAFISLQNGEIKTQQKFIRPLYVDEKVLFPGILNIGIHIYEESKCIKSWYCLPLEILDTKHGVVGFDKLFEIEKKVEKIEEFYNKLAENHNKLADTVSDIKEKIKEI